ncbi:hypothetical protein GCM10023074_33880 [Microbispora amethystogenes]
MSNIPAIPGLDHEMPIALIHNRPETALELLHVATGKPIPPFTAARVEAVDSSQPVPVERRADSVVVVRDEKGKATMAVIVEVQRGYDGGKRFNFEYLGEKYFSHWLEKGEAKGRAEGEAKAILLVLESRGLRISDEARERIRLCEDPEQPDAWARGAAVITSVDELFG